MLGRGSLILGFIWLSWSGGGLSSPLNSVFRWREPERWEGDCGAGVSTPPPIWEAHVFGQEGGKGGCIMWWLIRRGTLMKQLSPEPPPGFVLR